MVCAFWVFVLVADMTVGVVVLVLIDDAGFRICVYGLFVGYVFCGFALLGLRRCNFGLCCFLIGMFHL